MGLCAKAGYQRSAILALFTLACAACGSSSPTGPSSLSASGVGTGTTVGSGSAGAHSTGGAHLAAADTIRIVQGQLTLESNRTGTITLRGNHGFAFEGHTRTGLDPSNRCGPFTPCAPGQTIAFMAAWLGLDLPGSARLQGTEYVNVGGSISPSSLGIRLSGTFVAPAQGETASVTVPVTLEGTFATDEGFFDLTGDGEVTFTLKWQTAISRWAITASSFDFGGGRSN